MSFIGLVGSERRRLAAALGTGRVRPAVLSLGAFRGFAVQDGGRIIKHAAEFLMVGALTLGDLVRCEPYTQKR